MKVKLYAPEEYWKLSAEALLEISNGCGGKGVGALVPDSFFNCSIKPACDIHDYMYFIGEGDQGKVDADDVFLNNLVRIVAEKYKQDKRRWLYKIRLKLCEKYYYAVKVMGGPFYWEGKNKEGEEQIVTV